MSAIADTGTTVHAGVRALALALLATLVFVAHDGLAQRWRALGVFDQYNVLFDADPNQRLGCFAHGWQQEGRSIQHPNLCNFINPPVRALAKGLASVGGGSEEALREAIALRILPAAGTLNTLAVYGIATFAGMTFLPALLLAALSASAFSGLVFFSIPDHFGLGGLSLTLAFLLGLADLRAGHLRWPRWLALAVLTAGITITNLLGCAAVACCVLRRSSTWRSALSRAALLMVVAVAANLVLQKLLNLAYHAEGGDLATTVQFTQSYLRADPLATLTRFPLALAEAIAPATVGTVAARLAATPETRYLFVFSLEAVPMALGFGLALAGIGALALAGGARAGLGGTAAGSALLPAALLLLAWNGVLHAVWGNEYFLYSQHWQAAMWFLFALLLRRHAAPRITAALAAYTLLVAAHNAAAIGHMLDTLLAAPAR